MTTEEPSDNDLIDGYLAGDQAMFERLYERHRRPLYSYLNKMIPGQTSTVDDLFQKTWIKAINNLGKYQHRQTFRAWLYRIAHNNAIDHFRKAKREVGSEIEEERLSCSREIPWRNIRNEELTEAIKRAVEELPPEQVEVFRLRQEEVSFKDIAEIQGCSLNTVLGRMHYAVNKLRKLLKDWK